MAVSPDTQGTLGVVTDGTEVARLGPGEAVGETGLLKGAARVRCQGFRGSGGTGVRGTGCFLWDRGAKASGWACCPNSQTPQGATLVAVHATDVAALAREDYRRVLRRYRPDSTSVDGE